MQQRVYERRMNSVDELKQRLAEVWNSLQQNVIDGGHQRMEKATESLLCGDGQHFEHLLRARVTDTSYG